jgi:hypothetical protein
VHKRLISCPYRKPKQDLSVYQDADWFLDWLHKDFSNYYNARVENVAAMNIKIILFWCMATWGVVVTCQCFHPEGRVHLNGPNFLSDYTASYPGRQLRR